MSFHLKNDSVESYKSDNFLVTSQYFCKSAFRKNTDPGLGTMLGTRKMIRKNCSSCVERGKLFIPPVGPVNEFPLRSCSFSAKICTRIIVDASVFQWGQIKSWKPSPPPVLCKQCWRDTCYCYCHCMIVPTTKHNVRQHWPMYIFASVYINHFYYY